MDDWSDATLLADESDPAESFSAFYRRNVGTVLRFFARRGVSPHDAADLTAETFAAAFIGRKRCAVDDSALNWLLGIAAHKLSDSHRRFGREKRAVARLGLQTVEFSDEDEAVYEVLRRAERDRDPVAMRQLEELPEPQQRAIAARVLSEHSYAEVGREMGVPTATARQHVSRGLATLRGRLKGER